MTKTLRFAIIFPIFLILFSFSFFKKIEAACTSRNGPSIAPLSQTQTGTPPNTLTFTMTVTNNDTIDCGSSNFDMVAVTACPPGGWTCNITPTTIPNIAPGGGTGTAVLAMTPPAGGAGAGAYSIKYRAFNNSSGMPTIIVTSIYNIAAAPCTRNTPGISELNNIQQGTAGTPLSFTMTITNNDTAGCGPSNFHMEAMTTCPVSGESGWTCNITSPPMSNIAPGLSGTAVLTMTSPGSAAVGPYSVKYHAVNDSPGGLPSITKTSEYDVIAAACSARGTACAVNSDCCTNECGSSSHVCYDSALSLLNGSACYSNSECASLACAGAISPGNPGTCVAPVPGCFVRGTICAVNSDCCSNGCSGRSHVCYTPGLSLADGASCWDDAECLSTYCWGPQGVPSMGTCSPLIPACFVSFDNPTYKLGDIMIISYQSAPAGSFLQIIDSRSTILQTVPVDGWGGQTFELVPSYNVGTWTAKLTGVGCLKSATAQVSAPPCSVWFDKPSYNLRVDTQMIISYTNAPPGSVLKLGDPNLISHGTYLQTWVVTGSGSQTFPLLPSYNVGTWTAELTGGGCPSTDTAIVAVTCAPDGCNSFCPAGCTVAQDPDCDCKNGNGCCGIGCNNTNDSDCAGIILSCQVTNPPCDGNCPQNCTVDEDPDCGCKNDNSCCGIGCDITNDNNCKPTPPQCPSGTPNDADGDGYMNSNCPCDPTNLPPGIIGCKDCNDSDSGVTTECYQGGLVPCGRQFDNPDTPEDETAPCTLCHFFVLIKRIVDFATVYIIIPLAVLMFVVGGVMFLTSSGDSGRINEAKKILTASIIGLLIFLAAWMIVNTVVFFVVNGTFPAPGDIAKILGQPWNEINCSLGSSGGACSDRGATCTVPLDCCSKECSGFTDRCYDSTLSLPNNAECYHASECAGNVCMGPPNPATGAGFCEGGPAAVCGDGNCDPGETCVTCPADCDGFCVTSFTANPQVANVFFWTVVTIDVSGGTPPYKYSLNLGVPGMALIEVSSPSTHYVYPWGIVGYSSPGTWTATITVTDALGNTANKSITITAH